MVTCRDIITSAMRQSKTLSMGEDPEPEEADDGLFMLQGMYESLVPLFGKLSDVIATSDYDANMFERVRYETGTSITLPTTINDAGTDYPPFDLAYIETIDATAGTRAQWVYEAARGAWVALNDLDLDDTAPLVTRGRDGLAALLAAYWADEFGNAEDIPASVKMKAAMFRGSLATKYGGDRSATAAEYF